MSEVAIISERKSRRGENYSWGRVCERERERERESLCEREKDTSSQRMLRRILNDMPTHTGVQTHTLVLVGVYV